MLNKFDKAVKDYLNNLYHIGISDKTINNYSKRLGYFREFWAEGDPTDEPSVADVREWRDSLLERGLSPKTVKQYLIELNAFFEFCTDDYDGKPIFSRNPVSKRMFPRMRHEDEKPYEKLLDADDYMRLWENNYKGRSPLWSRDYAITVLLIDGKIRNAELLDMKLSDIDFEYNEVVIPKGKGNKRRWVTLSDISMTAIKLYLLSGYRPANVPDDDYLFGTKSNKGWGGGSNTGGGWHRGTSQWLSGLVEKHIRKVTGKAGFRSHSLRHNGARLDLNNGMSLERIQAELGHSSVQTTEIYAGRLQSVRHEKSYKDVIAYRDEWAQKNADKIEMLTEKSA